VSAGRHLDAALVAERDAYRAQLAGEPAARLYQVARDAYMASHAETGRRSWGRLIGALKMAILAGDGAERIAQRAIDETVAADGPAAAYAGALAAVVLGREPDVERMLASGGAFERTGRALAALAADDGGSYAAALAEMVADFEAREQHLSGVAVADTAMVLERLAAARGLAVRPSSPLVPLIG
jgi:hypothetical protein